MLTLTVYRSGNPNLCANLGASSKPTVNSTTNANDDSDTINTNHNLDIR